MKDARKPRGIMKRNQLGNFFYFWFKRKKLCTFLWGQEEKYSCYSREGKAKNTMNTSSSGSAPKQVEMPEVLWPSSRMFAISGGAPT